MMLLLLLARGSLSPGLAVTIPHRLGTRSLVQLTVQSAGVAVQFVVEAAPPERSVSSATVLALSFDSTRSRVVLRDNGRRARRTVRCCGARARRATVVAGPNA
jgi:hypothetical protein